jgi:hypothetical protein
MENGKQPAFQSSMSDMTTFHYGLTKREYFAGLVMQALLSSPHLETDDHEIISKDAVRYADALLKELDKS